jgi:hypothetical protein
MTASNVRAREREELRKHRSKAKAAKRQAPTQQAWRDAWEVGRRGERR